MNGLAFAPQHACTGLLASSSYQTLRVAALVLQVADMLLYRPKQRQVRAGVRGKQHLGNAVKERSAGSLPGWQHPATAAAVDTAQLPHCVLCAY